MATAPFTLNVTIPGDTDIVSQFPAVDRNHLDIINSWLKTDHNVNGTHNYATFLQVDQADSGGHTAGAVVPANKNTAVFRDIDGALKAVRGDDSTVEFLGGVPPGFMGPYAGSTLPSGWLWADGTAISRTTYARLFTAIGTLYGSGDGSTTFNLPDADNRVVIGKYRNTQRVSSAGSSINGAVASSSGGAENVTLDSTMIPAHSHTATSTDSGHFHTAPLFVGNQSSASGGGSLAGFASSTTTGISTANITTTIANTGGGLAHTNMPPTLVVGGMIIRF